VACLRHSFITQGLGVGVPIEVMMAQVGHVSAEMTRYYTHLANGSKQEAARVIFSIHANQRMFQRGIGRDAVLAVIVNGEMIADYPDDGRYPRRATASW
jgi:hypothetical protein